MAVADEALAEKLRWVLPQLDERQRRLVMGAEAKAIGHGGIRAVARAAGVSEPTVRRGKREIEQLAEGRPLTGRTRVPGGGRKPLTETDPELLAALERLVDPVTRGDPESPLKWTSKSTRKLAEELGRQGKELSYRSVGSLLRRLGYRLQSVRKTREGRQHPDRDAQFRYLAGVSNDLCRSCDPRA